MTPSPPEARPRFVDGIGPPLSQIMKDYATERTTPARDVVALVLEVERLDAGLRELQERLKREQRASDVESDMLTEERNAARAELRELQEALQREVWLREQAEKRVRELVGPLPSAEDVEGILAASSEEPGAEQIRKEREDFHRRLS